MTTDFRSLLAKPVGTLHAPKVLPLGLYPGLVSKFEFGHSSSERKTPLLRLMITLTGWADGVDEADMVNEDGKAIDITHRGPFRKEFYLTDDALYRLSNFLKEILPDSEGKDMFDTVPELVGQQVMVEMQHYTNQKTGELGNQIGNVSAPRG